MLYRTKFGQAVVDCGVVDQPVFALVSAPFHALNVKSSLLGLVRDHAYLSTTA
jgi:hypothetical protein